MTVYRQYRGLYGEPIRVPERTIAETRLPHGRGPFPFSAIASGLGRERDRFAEVALRAKWIDDTRGVPRSRRTTTPLAMA